MIWIELLSKAAFKKFGDEIEWQGAIYAIQKQLGLNIYPGPLSAISLHGSAHYISS
jgi:hypothetical protein